MLKAEPCRGLLTLLDGHATHASRHDLALNASCAIAFVRTLGDLGYASALLCRVDTELRARGRRLQFVSCPVGPAGC